MSVAPRELVTAAATGVFTLVEPSRLPPRLLRGYRLGAAALTGVGAYTALEDQPDVALRPGTRALVGVALAALVYGSMGLWEACDARTQGWLERRGVARPRLWMAAGALGLSLASSALEDRAAGTSAARPDPSGTDPSDTDPSETDPSATERPTP